jgi:hypothetical protein
MSPVPLRRQKLFWPVAGIIIGMLVAMIPSKTGIPLSTGIAAWFVAMLLVLVLSAHPTGTRLAALLAGLFMAVPCFVWASPFDRCLLMCFTAMPFVASAALVLIPPITSFRARLAYLLTWCGRRQISRRPRTFDIAPLRNLLVASAIFAAAVAVLAFAVGLGQAVRWLAAGIATLAFAEMATASFPFVSGLMGLTLPALMQSPYRSTSIGEFWTKRWNPAASEMFLNFCFLPLARHGVALALLATFALSALGHTLLVYLALGTWTISLICGAFFLVQPLLIAAERAMKVKRWRPAAARTWTLAALAMTSPLFLEPVLQILERSWGRPAAVLQPTLAFLAFVMIVSTGISLASLIALGPTGKPILQPSNLT